MRDIEIEVGNPRWSRVWKVCKKRFRSFGAHELRIFDTDSECVLTCTSLHDSTGKCTYPVVGALEAMYLLTLVLRSGRGDLNSGRGGSGRGD
jgi:hypothetical protein